MECREIEETRDINVIIGFSTKELIRKKGKVIFGKVTIVIMF